MQKWLVPIGGEMAWDIGKDIGGDTRDGASKIR